MTVTAELHYIQTADGMRFDLTDGYARFVLRTPAQMGIAGVETITLQAGQQGRLFRDYNLLPRELSIQIRYNGCNRADYWSGRLALLDALRPNRNGELTYGIKLEDGTTYVIKGVIANNPFADAGTGWDEHGYTETLTIICNDPIWYGGIINTVAISSAVIAQLVFPVTIDLNPQIVFYGGSAQGQMLINYTGTWYSYPTFRLLGPFTSVTLTHIQNRATIQVIYTISNGNALIIDVGARRVYNESTGEDLFGYLTSNTNLVDFRLEPDPIVTDGINNIEFNSTDAESQVGNTMSYYTRWIGI